MKRQLTRLQWNAKINSRFSLPIRRKLSVLALVAVFALAACLNPVEDYDNNNNGGNKLGNEDNGGNKSGNEDNGGDKPGNEDNGGDNESDTVAVPNYKFTADSAPATHIPVETVPGVLNLYELETYMDTATGAYTLTLLGDVNMSGTERHCQFGGAGKQLTITSDGTARRHIYQGNPGDFMFSISDGATLILDGSVTLQTVDYGVQGGNATLELKGRAIISGTGSTSHNGGVGVGLGNGTLIMSENAAISGIGGVGVSLGNGTLIMSGNAAISGNMNGGGVCFLGNGTLTMSGSAVISGNTASYDGGGVCFSGDNGTLTMSGSAAISGNTASSYGGGVYFLDNGTLTMSGSAVISGNTASRYGGGVRFSGSENNGTLNMSENATISGNISSVDGGVSFGDLHKTLTMRGNAVISKNTALNGGSGGVSSGKIMMYDNAVISGNTTKGNGGGVGRSDLTMNNNATISGNTAREGGGVWTYLLTMNGDAVISGNTAYEYGGGVYLNENYATLIMNGGSIKDNTVKNTAGDGTVYGGGGVYSYGTFNMADGASVTLNKVQTNGGTAKGGGVYQKNTGTFNKNDDCTVSGNQKSTDGFTWSVDDVYKEP